MKMEASENQEINLARYIVEKTGRWWMGRIKGGLTALDGLHPILFFAPSLRTAFPGCGF